MVYHIIALNNVGKKNNISDDINVEEYSNIRSKLSYMSTAIEHTTKCKIVQDNIRECLQLFDTLSPKKDHGKIFADVNRFFENTVNSFYSWTQFTEVHYNSSFYSTMRCELYDNNEDYRFTLALRTCSTHKVLPIKSLSFQLDGEQKAVIEIEPQFLIDNGDIPKGKAIYRELVDKEAKGEKINLKTLLFALSMGMPKYERMILREIHKEIEPWIRTFTEKWTDDMIYVAIYDENEVAMTGNLIGTFNEYHASLGTYCRKSNGKT